MFEWFRNLFAKEEPVDVWATRIIKLYRDLKFYYLSKNNDDPDFKVKWDLKNIVREGETGIAELKFNSILSPITLNIILDQHVGTNPKEWKLDYTLTYISEDSNEGFQLEVVNGDTCFLDSDFSEEEIDLALFEIEDYLRSC